MRNFPAVQRLPARKPARLKARIYFRHGALPLLVPVDAARGRISLPQVELIRLFNFARSQKN
jgi:hypothetical protein